MIVDDHAIANNRELFDRVTGDHSDFLWVSGGDDRIDVKTATAHCLSTPPRVSRSSFREMASFGVTMGTIPHLRDCSGDSGVLHRLTVAEWSRGLDS